MGTRRKKPEEFDGEPIKVGFWKTEGYAKHPPVTEPGGSLILDLVGRAFLAMIEAPLPSVFDHIDTRWSPAERDRVHSYIRNIDFCDTAQLGDSTCRICGKDNGCADYTDGWYVWPEGLAHYIRDHGVRPPAEFVNHVLRRTR